VRRLLDEGGADIEGCGGYGLTALLAAAGNGCRDVVECLLDRGAIIYNMHTSLSLSLSPAERDRKSKKK
jgi:ankyrin repeat protein